MVVPKSPLRGFTYGDLGAQIPTSGIYLWGFRCSNPQGWDSPSGIEGIKSQVWGLTLKISGFQNPGGGILNDKTSNNIVFPKSQGLGSQGWGFQGWNPKDWDPKGWDFNRAFADF